jgi:hypothetical protein
MALHRCVSTSQQNSVEERPLAHHCSFPISSGWRRGEGVAMVTWLFCAREQSEIPAKGLVDGNDRRRSGSHKFFLLYITCICSI